MKCIVNGRIVFKDKVLSGMAIVFGERIEKIVNEKEIAGKDKEGIKCLMPDGTIAGSVLKLNEAVGNLYENTEFEIYEAVKCASLNIAKVLGEDKNIGSLEEGKIADIIIVDEKFNVEMTILDGEIKCKGEYRS